MDAQFSVDLRGRFDTFRARAGHPSTPDEFGWDLYRAVHCGISPDAQLFADMALLGTHLRRAYDRLMPFVVPRLGWTGWNPDRSALLDRRGVEVVPPVGATVDDTDKGPVLYAPSLAPSPNRRWLQWNSADPLPREGYRVYVSAQPEQAFDAWLDTVQELASNDIRSAAKVACSTELARRSDCIVVYGDETALPGIIDAVRRVVDGGRLRPDVPGFAVPLGRGVSLGLSDGPLPFAESLGWTWSSRLAQTYLAGDDSQVDHLFVELQGLFDRTYADLPTRSNA
ncbi:T3SS effector HopA1 family protein [Micromonospora matsumotoense]|uniref:T3SS effector HopA1 family protein n=1 Tax=Micromonospora matsumotoense TaxID=121616 RepID=UPI0033C4C65C